MPCDAAARARGPAAQAALALIGGHPCEREGKAAEQEVNRARVEQTQQQIEFCAICCPGQRGDLPRDLLVEVRRAVGNKRRCDRIAGRSVRRVKDSTRLHERQLEPIRIGDHELALTPGHVHTVPGRARRRVP